MVRLAESGRIEEVVFTRLGLGEDTLKALHDTCRERDIRIGTILDSGGSVVDFTYRYFPINSKLCPINISTGAMHGKREISLQGTIGTMMYNPAEGDIPDMVVGRTFPTVPRFWEGSVDKWPMVGCEYRSEIPCIHAHCVASNTDYMVCGHLVSSTRVASNDPNKLSYLTVVIAKVSGAGLRATIDHKIGFYQNFARVDE